MSETCATRSRCIMANGERFVHVRSNDGWLTLMRPNSRSSKAARVGRPWCAGMTPRRACDHRPRSRLCAKAPDPPWSAVTKPTSPSRQKLKSPARNRGSPAAWLSARWMRCSTTLPNAIPHCGCSECELQSAATRMGPAHGGPAQATRPSRLGARPHTSPDEPWCRARRGRPPPPARKHRSGSKRIALREAASASVA